MGAGATKIADLVPELKSVGPQSDFPTNSKGAEAQAPAAEAAKADQRLKFSRLVTKHYKTVPSSDTVTGLPPLDPSLLDHICIMLPASCVVQARLEPNIEVK